MGVIKDAFGWILGITSQSIDSINVEELEEKLRGTKRLQAQWEREIQQAAKEYNEHISPEKNLRRSPIERTLAIQKAKIAAKRASTLTNSVSMLYRLSGVVEQVKLLKKFYKDLCETSKLPKGLTLEQFVKQVEKLSDVLHLKQSEIEKLTHAMEDINRSMDAALGDSGTNKELEALFEKYATLVAEGNTSEAEKVKAQIDKMAGVPEMA
ncbi:MAG: hypothetical protein ONB24_14830 [candidate division KSB1 bacterium]|nr:hypothetical protein [candidate division KSB1 bacterium]